MFGDPGPRCDGGDASAQVRSTVRADLLEGRYAERGLAARGPHSGRRSLKLKDLEILIWQSRYIVILGGVGAAVGAGDKTLGAWPAVRHCGVARAGGGR